MCLIVAKPAGVSLDEKFFDIIRASIISNDDGSGYMYKKDKSSTIHLHKGFFSHSIEGMIADIKNSSIEANDFLVVHNRMATSGYKDEANCHPFPVSTDDGLLSADTLLSNVPCVAHNGVFGDYSRMSNVHSDTYMFVKTFLAPNKVLDYRRGVKWLGTQMGFNKLAILHPEFGICLIGNFQKEGNYFVSNKGYEWSLNNMYKDKNEYNYAYHKKHGRHCGL